MLLQFTVGNYLSFQGKETFSLVATEMTELKENKLTIEEGFEVLRSAAIYGANASGKSNVLSAINFMKNLVIRSFKSHQVGDKIRVLPFKLDQTSKEQPSYFEINFYDNGHLVRFGFEVNEVEVVKEWLFIDEKKIYERKKQQLDSNSPVLEEDLSIDLKWSMTRQNVLFISVLASTNTPFAENLNNYFRTKVNIISGIDVENSHFTKYLLQAKNKDDYKRILLFLNSLDINITGLSVKKGEYRIHSNSDELPEELKEFLAIDSLKVITEHNVYDKDGKVVGSTEFLAEELESTGTNQLIAFAGPIIDTLRNGGSLFIDEMDAQLHPLLSKAIIELFNSDQTNKMNAQLVITTHNVTNLSNDLLRRDQIWFVEKDRKERSHLTSLVEYKFDNKRVRSDEVYNRNYLKGKYGAIPFLPQEIKILNANFDD